MKYVGFFYPFLHTRGNLYFVAPEEKKTHVQLYTYKIKLSTCICVKQYAYLYDILKTNGTCIPLLSLF
jgi:hypothetical protein